MASMVVSTEPPPRREPVHGPAPRHVLGRVVGENGHGAEAERHERAEAHAERGQHGEGHHDPHEQRRGEQGVGEQRQHEGVEEGERDDRAGEDGDDLAGAVQPSGR